MPAGLEIGSKGLNPFIHQVFFPTLLSLKRPQTWKTRCLNPFIHQVFFPTEYESVRDCLIENKVSIPLFIRSSFPRDNWQTKEHNQFLKESQSLYSSGLLSHIEKPIKEERLRYFMRLNPFIHQVFFPTGYTLTTNDPIVLESQSLYSSGLLSHIRGKVIPTLVNFSSLNPFIHQVFFPTMPLIRGKVIPTLVRSQSLYSSGLLSHE